MLWAISVWSQTFIHCTRQCIGHGAHLRLERSHGIEASAALLSNVQEPADVEAGPGRHIQLIVGGAGRVAEVQTPQLLGDGGLLLLVRVQIAHVGVAACKDVLRRRPEARLPHQLGVELLLLLQLGKLAQLRSSRGRGVPRGLHLRRRRLQAGRLAQPCRSWSAGRSERTRTTRKLRGPMSLCCGSAFTLAGQRWERNRRLHSGTLQSFIRGTLGH
jgi:hypothetical protein